MFYDLDCTVKGSLFFFSHICELLVVEIVEFYVVTGHGMVLCLQKELTL